MIPCPAKPGLEALLPRRFTFDADELEERYIREGLSIQECADHFGCSTTLIEFRLAEYGIPTRPPGSQPVEVTRDELEELYVEQGLTTIEVADRLDCHPSTVGKKLREHGIPRTGENHGRSIHIPERELAVLYIEEGQTTYQLAERFECGPTVIERRLRWYGIDTRHTSAGDRGGSYNYGSNWKRQRRKALEQAGYRCERCGMTQAEHRERYGDPTRGVGLGLDVHHRVKAKLCRRWDLPSLEEANRLANLEVLCQECHRRFGDRIGLSEAGDRRR